MLTKVGLENFKSWQKLDLDLANLTLLFGTNSSGKSSVLQALLLLKQTAMGIDRRRPLNLGGDDRDYFDFGAYQNLAFAHAKKISVGIDLEWKRKSENLAYEVRWQQLSSSRIVVRNLEYRDLSQIDPNPLSLEYDERKDEYLVQIPNSAPKREKIDIWNGYAPGINFLELEDVT